MVDVQRAAKMADRIKEIVARRLDKGVRDPRMGFVTITDVKMTGDLQHASIFYTVYGTDEERADTAAALASATGMLRSEVGRNITARLTPSLEFIPDGIPENAALIADLLAEAQSRDAEVEALKSTAKYAGDEDPYVKPARDRRGLITFSNRLSTRSASGLPPVWQVGQYSNVESANRTWRTVSPQIGQASPLRPCTRRFAFFSALSSLAAKPSDRSIASRRVSCIASYSRCTSSSDIAAGL